MPTSIPFLPDRKWSPLTRPVLIPFVFNAIAVIAAITTIV